MPKTAEYLNKLIILLHLLSSIGPDNADLIARLPVGTTDVYFRMKQATYNNLGKTMEEGRKPNAIVSLFHCYANS